MEIVPTILTADFEEFSQKIKLLSGITDRVQVDFVDGKFAPKQTVSLEVIKTIGELETMKVDLHLMVKEPVDWITRALEILPDRIIAQVEMMKDPMEFIAELAETGVEVGLGLDLETPISVVSDEAYSSVDLILLMAHRVGESGLPFDPKVLDKIAQISKIIGEGTEIAVDGGLNQKNIKLAGKNGASIFYVGSSFWSPSAEAPEGQAPDLKKRYNELAGLLNND